MWTRPRGLSRPIVADARVVPASLSRPRSPLALSLTQGCSAPSRVLSPRLLPAHVAARLPPSWVVGAFPAPLRPGGAAATSDGGAHASRRKDLARSATRACCDDTSSDDDVHNTSNTFFLLCADALIADMDELKVALGCRFALDVFTIIQQSPIRNP